MRLIFGVHVTFGCILYHRSHSFADWEYCSKLILILNLSVFGFCISFLSFHLEEIYILTLFIDFIESFLQSELASLIFLLLLLNIQVDSKILKDLLEKFPFPVLCG